MDKRNEFAEILYSARYANIADPAVAEKSLSAIATWIKSNIPEKLYRYRAFSDKSISAFRKDEIWASTPATFNDSLECMPCFDQNRAKAAIESEFNIEKLTYKLNAIREGDVLPGLKAIFPTGYIDNFIKDMNSTIGTLSIEKISIEARNAFTAILECGMVKYAGDFYSSINDSMKYYMVACFSETNTSSLMWGHYAQSHRGFCLEYNFQPIVGDCTRKCNDILQCNNLMLNYALAPIIYSPKRFDATESYIAMVINELKDSINSQIGYYYPDVLLPMKLLLSKSADWEYEKEWRLFKGEGQTEDKHKCIAPIKPTAVYCGTNMHENDKSIIVSIAKEKGIPCYQMIPQYFNSEYEIRAVDMSLLEERKS